MTLLIGEPTATVQSWVTTASGANKKASPCTLLECLETGTLEELRLWVTATTATTKVVLGIYADNGSGTSPTGTPLGEASKSPEGGSVGEKTWVPVTGLSVPVVKGTKYWLAGLGVGVAFKYSTKASGGAGNLIVKNNASIEDLKTAQEWVEVTKNGPASLQGNGTAGAASAQVMVV